MPILEANSAAHERVWQAKVEVKEKKTFGFCCATETRVQDS
jgi:hypothetical protein